MNNELNVESKLTILGTNIFYLLVGIILLAIGSLVQSWDIYKGLIITEYIIILLPVLIYLKIKGQSLKEVLRLNKLSLKQILLIPIIVILSYPIGAFLNLIAMIFLSFFGEIKPPPIPIPNNEIELLKGFFVVALSAGICEEVMFRGLIMKGYENLGKWKAIIFSAVLFGFFHFNIQNLLGPIFLGLLFGYIVYKTDSLFASMLAHFTNNAFALFLGFIVNKFNTGNNAPNNVSLDMSYTKTLIYGAIFLGAISLVTGTIVVMLLKKMPGSDEYISFYRKDNKKSMLTFVESIPLIIILIIFIVINVLNFKV
ncbi:type II CAAX endopeptidase family protein [Caloranaerobacter ferrireducens]|uniref:type II CAAX endopeptidase family protein n=1 Tax=Caloranaerobacter ferrireducens TaxID=1323370 RepID=UPI0009F3DCEC|nr:type II CAAX endopeptidase family protein [Caloranaerobacter ferrireducens]